MDRDRGELLWISQRLCFYVVLYNCTAAIVEFWQWLMTWYVLYLDILLMELLTTAWAELTNSQFPGNDKEIIGLSLYDKDRII